MFSKQAALSTKNQAIPLPLREGLPAPKEAPVVVTGPSPEVIRSYTCIGVNDPPSAPNPDLKQHDILYLFASKSRSTVATPVEIELVDASWNLICGYHSWPPTSLVDLATSQAVVARMDAFIEAKEKDPVLRG